MQNNSGDDPDIISWVFCKKIFLAALSYLGQVSCKMTMFSDVLLAKSHELFSQLDSSFPPSLSAYTKQKERAGSGNFAFKHTKNSRFLFALHIFRCLLLKLKTNQHFVFLMHRVQRKTILFKKKKKERKKRLLEKNVFLLTKILGYNFVTFYFLNC